MELDKLISTSALVIMLHYYLIQLWKKSKRRRSHGRRRWWVRPINRAKDQFSYRTHFMREIETQDHEEFYHNFRMWPEQFNWLLDRVRGQLQKRSRRTPLDPKLRLQVTLL